MPWTSFNTSPLKGVRGVLKKWKTWKYPYAEESDCSILFMPQTSGLLLLSLLLFTFGLSWTLAFFKSDRLFSRIISIRLHLLRVSKAQQCSSFESRRISHFKEVKYWHWNLQQSGVHIGEKEQKMPQRCATSGIEAALPSLSLWLREDDKIWQEFVCWMSSCGFGGVYIE